MTGPAAILVRAVLLVASVPYGLIVWARNALYDTGCLRASRVPVPVVCVGNLTTGGTGKTPLVVWLAQIVRSGGKRAAILTRGYGTRAAVLSDEPAELSAACPEVPVIVNPDRVAGAAQAVEQHGAEVLLMDDGFQHRRLARDLDIVAVDATAPFGYGRLLPAGLLREPASGLARAQAIVLTRCDQVEPASLASIERRIRHLNPTATLARAVHEPSGIRTRGGASMDLDAIADMRVFAFCGLGNPEAFFETLRRIGGILTGSRVFDDHHDYTNDCLASVLAEARSNGAQLALTTAKDWTKLAELDVGEAAPPLACLTVRMTPVSGASALTALIEGTLAGRMPRRQS
jgi:tetraacyldisaccharide 4'-kinase